MAIPTYEVRIDWDGDGLTTGAQDNITGDVLKLRLDEGIDVFGGSGELQTLVITVDNNGGKYHDLNSSSPLFGKLKPLRRVHVNATYAGTTVGLFEGYVDAFAPVGLEGDRQAEIICSGILPRLQHTNPVKFSIDDWSPYDARTYMFSGSGAMPSYLGIDLSTDTAEQMVIGHWSNEQSSLAVLRRMNEATLTRHFIRPANVFTGTTAHYVTIGRNDGIDGTPDDAWAKGTDFDRVVEWSGPAGALVNRQNVYGQAHRWGAVEEVWRYEDGLVTIPPGTDFDADVSHVGQWVRDYVVNYVEIAGDVVAATTGTAYEHSTSISVLADAFLSDTVLSELWLSGRVDHVTDITATTNDAASQAIYGIVEGEYISSELIRSAAQAKGLADHVVWRNAAPRRRLTLRQENRHDAVVVQRRWPGQVVTVTDPEFGLSAFRAQIIERSMVVDVAGEAWIETLKLEEMPPAVQPFIIGSSLIGGAHILAR
jgi:hypothetical protein